jgi:hypothetical protein
MLASVVFRYDTQSAQSTSYVDTQMRPLDGNFSYGEVPVSIYGQANANTMAGKQEYNFLGVYGHAGNSTASNQYNQVRAITDTFYDPPTNVGPTGVVPNERPTLQVRVQNSGLYPNIKGKIEWNLATNSGFSSNLKTIIEPDSNYRYFGSTNSSVPPQYNISLMLSGVGSQQLFTGTWYMRSRVVSDLGQVSAWSTTTTFAVLHKPAALPKSPNVASFSVYDANGVPFTWVFSDTETTDVQTAYQLLIVRTDTGATVLDTGKVASSVNGATVSLSSTLKDISLQWQVSLWDTDDVQGPFCNPVAFMVGDAPSVRVTSPTDGSTVTTAVPTITWAFTGGGTRTQRAFKVSILAADTLDTFTRTISNNWGTVRGSVRGRNTSAHSREQRKNDVSAQRRVQLGPANRSVDSRAFDWFRGAASRSAKSLLGRGKLLRGRDRMASIREHHLPSSPTPERRGDSSWNVHDGSYACRWNKVLRPLPDGRKSVSS